MMARYVTGRYPEVFMCIPTRFPSLLAGLAGLAAAFSSLSPPLAAPAPEEGAIPNPSFEATAGDQPRGWRPVTWGGTARFSLASPGRTGRWSAAVSSTAGADAGWQAAVPVRPLSRYRLRGWIRTEDVTPRGGRGALLNLHDIQPVATRAVTGTAEWTEVEVVFDTGERDAVLVNCLFGGWGVATGTAWFDDLQLELLEKGEWETRIEIDASRRGAPISRYVYGQFIEHLGRCIYGGIWAEMLQDRKFFSLPGSKESPWQVIGGPERVASEMREPLAGEQDARVLLPGDGRPAGLRQEGLGLWAGKEYRGRIWLAGSPGAAPVEVRLVWGEGEAEAETVRIEELGPEPAKYPLRFQPARTTDSGRLEITSRGQGFFRAGAVSLMPADNVLGMRRDTLELLEELGAPVYRWPGGNFVSGYDWRDGIGDPDRRPPRKNPAWQGIESNDFGIDEFMTFCRVLETEPYVVVNSGLGEVESAVEELQYANGAADTPMGRLRARNGHPEPYGVKWWGIGNEMYGSWQLGHMPLERYVEKHNRFARAMRSQDPSIRLIAVGAAGAWSEGMLRHCADHMDLLSEHFYRGEAPGLVSHVRQIPAAIRGITDAHREYRKRLETLGGRDLRIALDEWNYWYGPHLYGELGTRYFLKDALGIAAGLNEFARQSDLVFMANYAQTVNVIGCIKTTSRAAALATTGLVLKLYRRRFGHVPVAVAAGFPLDVAAAWTGDGRFLTLAVVNPTREAIGVPLEIRGARAAGPVELWRIAGTDPMAYNEPERPPRVAIEEGELDAFGDRLAVPGLSVTVYRIPAERLARRGRL